MKRKLRTKSGASYLALELVDPTGPHRGARLERRRAARRPLRRRRRRARARPGREVPRPAAARRALARGRRRRSGVADAGDAARRATSSPASSSFSSPRSRIRAWRATVRAVLARLRARRVSGDARRPPLLRRRPARAHGRGRDAVPRDGAAASRACAPTCCSPRRSCTTSAGRVELGRGPAFAVDRRGPAARARAPRRCG